MSDEIETREVRARFVSHHAEGARVHKEHSRQVFNAWYASELAAAEKRGAQRALKDYRQFMVRVIKPGLVNREGLIADIDESLKRLDETGYMLMGPLSRADQNEEDQ